VLATLDWTPILSALLGGATALGAAALTSFLSAKSAATQAAVQVADTEQRRVDELRATRREVYSRYLAEERRVWLETGHADSADEVGESVRSLYAASNEVQLVGGPAVATAATQLHNYLGRMERLAEEYFVAVGPEGNDSPVAEAAGALMRAARYAWLIRRRKLIDLMRAEVVPDAAPIHWEEMDEDAAYDEASTSSA
jgi:hypothetical protein